MHRRVRTLGGIFGLVGALALLLLLGTVYAQTGTGSGPRADFLFDPQDPDINTEVLFDARASSPDIVRYEWDFNGDGVFEIRTDDPTVTYLFDTSGSHRVTLRVTDGAGAQALTAQDVGVRAAPVRVRRVIESPLEGYRVPAGSAFQVTIEIVIHETINGLGLDEDLPEGWRVGSVDPEGAAFKGSQAQWLWFRTLTPGEELRVIYSVTVPQGTRPDVFEIQGVVSSFSPRFRIEIPGDREIRVF